MAEGPPHLCRLLVHLCSHFPWPEPPSSMPCHPSLSVLWGREGWGVGSYLLQVVKLHGDLPEEEVDVAAPLHRVDKVGLCKRGGVRTLSLMREREFLGLGTPQPGWLLLWCWGTVVENKKDSEVFISAGRGVGVRILKSPYLPSRNCNIHYFCCLLPS